MPALPAPLIKSEFRLESNYYSPGDLRFGKSGPKRAVASLECGERTAKAN